MLKINPTILTNLRNADSLAELQQYLQLAIELEHATIPPYLTAKFSLKNGTNNEIRELLHSIVVEEMLHMTIASNILNAIGGKPKINKEEFIPSYPGNLPMQIGDDLIVGLEKYSKELIKRVFMEIEEPEDPIIIENITAGEDEEEEFNTIGQFYQAIKLKIDGLPGTELPGDPNRQVTNNFYSSEELFPIVSKEDAARAIDIIVEQGEGTTTSPIDFEGEMAHYYSFEEMYVGRKLVKNDQEYSFTGPVIPFNEQGIHNIFPNTKSEMLSEGTEERRNIDEFNRTYSRLLNGLHITFNGMPNYFPHTLGLMYDLKLIGEKLCSTPFPGKAGYTIGPSFQYVKLPASVEAV